MNRTDQAPGLQKPRMSSLYDAFGGADVPRGVAQESPEGFAYLQQELMLPEQQATSD